MKSKLLIFIFFFVLSLNYSQTAFFHTYSDTSLNNNFIVELSGNMYEGYVGNQTVKLYNRTKNLIWERVFNSNGLGIPYVSNDGNVALIQKRKNILFIDKDGKDMFEYIFESNYQFAYYEDPTENISHAFSTDGNLLFSLLENKDDYNRLELLCISISGEQKWKSKLQAAFPIEIIVFDDYLILHNLFFSSTVEESFCYAFDKNGNTKYYYAGYQDLFTKNRYVRKRGYKRLELKKSDNGIEIVLIEYIKL